MMTPDCAALRKHAGHRQSSPEPASGIGIRKSSAAHQHAPVPAPHSNGAPQRAQVRRRSVDGGGDGRLTRPFWAAAAL